MQTVAFCEHTQNESLDNGEIIKYAVQKITERRSAAFREPRCK